MTATATDHGTSPGEQGGSSNHRRIQVRVVGDEQVASTRFRVLAHLEALRASGFDVDLQMQTAVGDAGFRWPSRLAELVRDTIAAPDADLLLIHRRTYPPPFARRLRSFELPVVFDLDDALYLPPPSAAESAAKRRSYRRNFDATAAAADLVICGNAEIARQVPHERTKILPTAIDCRRFSPSAIEPATGPVIGWVGYSDNLPYLESLAEPFAELAHRHPGLRLLVVADRPPKIDGVEVDFRPWTLATEVACFNGMSVGVMPLDDTPWTRAKCSFKLLQYMALGIPSVASPVGMNSEVVDDGVNGWLASTPEQWFDCLDQLLGSKELRLRFAAAGRQTALDKYSLEVLTPRLVDLLENVEKWRREPEQRSGGLR